MMRKKETQCTAFTIVTIERFSIDMTTYWLFCSICMVPLELQVFVSSGDMSAACQPYKFPKQNQLFDNLNTKLIFLGHMINKK